MRALLWMTALVMAAGLTGCATDPHPASRDTPGDPWHPPSNQPDASSLASPSPPPETVTGNLDTTHTTQVQ